MNKKIKISLIVIVFIVLGINTVAIFHAYKFTHFDESLVRTESPDNLSFTEKMFALFFGVSNPKPKAIQYPLRKYSKINLGDTYNLSLWKIDVKESLGTVVLFHGFASEKSSLIPYSNIFNELGYNTVLVDFRGCGESRGINTTIGFYESEDVFNVYKYVINELKEDNIILFGSSMGAAAIIKSINDFNISPDKLILLNPFQNLQIAIENRFKMMGINPFFFSDLLLFWGGVLNNFNGFEFENDVYAKSIMSDILFFYGKNDKRVNHSEVKNIYENINSIKYLKYYQKSGHGDYLENEYDRFYKDVKYFLNENNKLNEFERDSLLEYYKINSDINLSIEFNKIASEDELNIRIINNSKESLYTSPDHWSIYGEVSRQLDIEKSIHNIICINDENYQPFKNGVITMSMSIKYNDSTLNLIKIDPSDTIKLNFIDDGLKSINGNYLHLLISLIDSTGIKYLNSNMNNSILFKKINIISNNEYKIHFKEKNNQSGYEYFNFLVPFKANQYYYLLTKDTTLKHSHIKYY